MTGFVVVVGVLTLLVGLIWWGQEKLVFFPPRPPYPNAPGVQRLVYTAADGQQLFSFVVGDPRSGPRVLLTFHGNADLAVHEIEWARHVHARTGYVVVLAEYRGYMGLGGKPTYAGTLLDARAAYAAVRSQLGAEPSNIAFFGYSLGSAVAAELAVKYEPSALLLQAPFTSAREMAPRVVTPLLALAFNMVSRVHFDTRAAVASIAAPVWVVHGTGDGVIEVDMGRAVFAAAKHKGDLLLVDGADHNDLAERGGDAYWAWIERALK